MRELFVTVHRWAGLFTAVFLFIAGLTGSLISWDHELDEWLNPHLFNAPETGAPLPALELVRRFEADHPQGRVTSFPLAFEKGHTADLFVEPRIDPNTGELYSLDYNQAFVDPASGNVLGQRYWGRISLDSENLLPFLYKLHYSMHIPDFYNFDRWGVWFMGIVGIVWMFDCFVGLYLTFPKRRAQTRAALAGGLSRAEMRNWWDRWKPAWKIKTRASAYRINFDMHRAFGLWLWLMLLIIAFTSISMNLGDEIVRPILSRISTLTPDASDGRAEAPLNRPIVADVPFSSAINTAVLEAEKRTWEEPIGSTFYDQSHGMYAVSFFKPGDEHGSAGMGVKTLYVDGKTGAVMGETVPWKGTAADVFMQLQFPLHSGRIAGVPGRVFLTIMGIVIAMLSATGIFIWFKKRQARLRVRHGVAVPAPGGAASPGVLGAVGAWFTTSEERAGRLSQRISENSETLETSAGPPWRQVALVLGDLAQFVLALSARAALYGWRLGYAEVAPRASRLAAFIAARTRPVIASWSMLLSSSRTRAASLARVKLSSAGDVISRLRESGRSE